MLLAILVAAVLLLVCTTVGAMYPPEPDDDTVVFTEGDWLSTFSPEAFVGPWIACSQLTLGDKCFDEDGNITLDGLYVGDIPSGADKAWIVMSVRNDEVDSDVFLNQYHVGNFTIERSASMSSGTW